MKPYFKKCYQDYNDYGEALFKIEKVQDKFRYHQNSIYDSSDEKPEECVKLNISKTIMSEYNSFIKFLDTNSYMFNLIYFFFSISLIFILVIVHILLEVKAHEKKHKPLTFKLFPGFFSLKMIQPQFFLMSIIIITGTGMLNVWNFNVFLMQRFLVPELRKSKFIIYLMLIVGLISNIILIFFALSSDSVRIDVKTLKMINISFSIVIFLLFILFNLFYSLLSWLALERLLQHKHGLERSMRDTISQKKCVIFLELVMLCLYIFTIIAYNCYKLKKHEGNISQIDTNYYHYLKFGFFILPYCLYILNAFLNLTYYNQVIKIQNYLDTYIDPDFEEDYEDKLCLV